MPPVALPHFFRLLLALLTILAVVSTWYAGSLPRMRQPAWGLRWREGPRAGPHAAALASEAARSLAPPPRLHPASPPARLILPLLLPLHAFESAVDRAPAALRIFFVITMSWLDDAGAPREKLFLDALFLAQPNARVFFVATTPHAPAPALLASYLARGYALHGVHMPCTALVPAGWWRTTENRAWLQQNCGFAAEEPGRQFFFSHITDYIRFYLLSRWSGVYTDTDAVFLRPLPTSGYFAGLDLASDPAEGAPERIEWLAFPADNLYAAPGLMRISAPLAQAALSIFDNATYDPACFNCIGPMNFNLVLKQPAFAFSGLRLLERHVLYPLSWFEAHLLFDGGVRSVSAMSPAAWLAHVRRVSTAVHLFGGMTKFAAVRNDSIISQLASQLSLMAPAPADDCRFSAPATLVVVGDRLLLVGAALVFLRDCSLLTAAAATAAAAAVAAAPGYALRLAARHGSLALAAPADEGAARVSPSAAAVRSLADVNRLLAGLVYSPSLAAEDALYTRAYYEDEGSDELRVALLGPDGAIIHEVAITLLIFNRLVTLVTHTSGRELSVRNMYASLQLYFPGTRLMASNDAVSGSTHTGSFGALMQWVDVPADCGLSFARNTLTRRAATPFVLLLDDDFIMDHSSHLDILLATLFSSSYDIAAAVVPADAAKFGNHFRGLMRVTAPPADALELVAGDYGIVENCLHMDFVPNTFMARQTALRRVQWDPALKLGEHEDFFLRAKQAGLRVLSCDHVHVKHVQFDWWVPAQKSSTMAAYVDKRQRVYDFFLVSLRKHGLKRLVTFGMTMADVGVSAASPTPSSSMTAQ